MIVGYIEIPHPFSEAKLPEIFRNRAINREEPHLVEKTA